jgi:hypothetical protein
MRSLRKIQKSAFAVFLIFEFFITSAFPASAGLFGSGGGISIPSTSQIASELERRYNLDLGAIQNQGQLFNVADNKKPTPEVSIFFTPSDPKEGEKISAKAFPIYFSNPEESLYYTWTLKHAGCDLTNSPSAATRALCDRNSDGNITVEDWKIEAANILVQNGYDNSATSYASGSDDDGYRAKYGGDNKTNAPNHCYVNDPSSGTNYELADASDTSFTCPAGTSAVCMVGQGSVATGTNDIVSGGNSYFDVSDSNLCYVSGIPACSSGTPLCNVGSPRCVADPTTTTSCGSALSSCSTSTTASVSPYCKHLFPNASSATSGDGSFGTNEEQFWGTDPNDPDTADNGNKDEANIVGLGRSTFTWNYVAGDEVGVAVEGTSMIATKHNDASAMIMWAFSKKDCPLSLASGTGSYTKSIKGYLVNIPTADFDLNKCIEKNLVDPTQGGQATNLEVVVNATPDNPVNDETADKGGDTIIVQASVSNAQRSLSNMFFDWKAEISDNIQFSSALGDVADVTGDLNALGLLGNTKGNALDSLKMKLDMRAGTSLGGRPLSAYLSGGAGYLRFTSRVTENFSSGITRKGRSDVIVKFTSSGKKISAYKANAALSGGTMKAALPGASGLICNLDALDRTACRVIKNEIIGLKIDPTGLSNFQWTINGAPLLCSYAKMSTDCTDGSQNEVNFFPVTGNIGDTYTVIVTANDVATGNVVTLTRAFHIVSPLVSIVSVDQNLVWPKLLGQYKDITGQATTACPGGLCNDYSTSMFQAFSGSQLGFRAVFVPSFLGSVSQREWRVDGEVLAESAPSEISFTASKPALGIYNVSLAAQVAQSNDIRRALLDVWDVSPFDSPEITFAVANQVELQEPGLVEGPLQGERQYLAAIASYVPASVLFTFRILLSAVLILFTTSFLSALLQDRRIKAFVSGQPQAQK